MYSATIQEVSSLNHKIQRGHNDFKVFFFSTAKRINIIELECLRCLNDKNKKKNMNNFTRSGKGSSLCGRTIFFMGIYTLQRSMKFLF